MIERLQEGLGILFVTGAIFYLFVLLLNICLFVAVMFFAKDALVYEIIFFFLSIIGAKFLTHA